MQSSKPVIGISAYREEADWGSWHGVRADLLPASYAEAVTAAGGVPVLLPASLDAEAAAAVLSRVDGLILAGGADVNPAQYRADAAPQTSGWRTDRDASELALLDEARGRALPTLGICRGMQIMAVAAGGSLAQHVPDLVGHQGHSPAPGVYGRTSVEVAPASQLAGILGDRLTVPCHHHQSVDEHPGFAPVARAADGLLEAMENPDLPFWLAVQWHPETDTDRRLFDALVAAARA
jgi:putative glutamine amidotransferase